MYGRVKRDQGNRERRKRKEKNARQYLYNTRRTTPSSDDLSPIFIFTPGDAPATICLSVPGATVCVHGIRAGDLGLLEGSGDESGGGAVEGGEGLGRGGEGEGVCAGEVSGGRTGEDVEDVELVGELPGDERGLVDAFVDAEHVVGGYGCLLG